MDKKKKICASVILGVLFLLLIVLVKVFDVDAIGPQGTEIGFSHVNRAVHQLFGVKEIWYDITKLFGLLALALVGVFGLMGLLQLIQRKNLLKVDREILCLGGLYIVVFALYALFEIVVINYRPIIMEGETAPEASFPSSHTMLFITVLGSAMMVLGKYVKNENLAKLLRIVCAVLIVVMVCGRLICGVHWFTDILGGILISSALLFLFSAVKE